MYGPVESARSDGYYTAQSNEQSNTNPFEPDTPEYVAWDEGYWAWFEEAAGEDI